MRLNIAAVLSTVACFGLTGVAFIGQPPAAWMLYLSAMLMAVAATCFMCAGES